MISAAGYRVNPYLAIFSASHRSIVDRFHLNVVPIFRSGRGNRPALTHLRRVLSGTSRNARTVPALISGSSVDGVVAWVVMFLRRADGRLSRLEFSCHRSGTLE